MNRRKHALRKKETGEGHREFMLLALTAAGRPLTLHDFRHQLQRMGHHFGMSAFLIKHDHDMLPDSDLQADLTYLETTGHVVRRPDGAWELCRFLSRPEMQEVFIVEDNWALPGRKSVTQAWVDGVLNTGSGEPKHVQVWPDNLETGRTVPITAAEKEMEDVYPNLIGPVLTTGEKRAEEVLPHIQEEIQKVLDKYAD